MTTDVQEQPTGADSRGPSSVSKAKSCRPKVGAGKEPWRAQVRGKSRQGSDLAVAGKQTICRLVNATCTASPAPCNTCTRQLGQLSTPTTEFTLLLQTCTYTRTHLSRSIIYTCGIRRADERDLGLKLCKQQQLLPIPTTTKGRRSPEVRWVPSN